MLYPSIPLPDRTELLQMFRDLATEITEKDFQHVEESNVIAELGVDSLAMLEVVGEMERELQIQIPDDDLNGVETVGQLLDVASACVPAG